MLPLNRTLIIKTPLGFSLAKPQSGSSKPLFLLQRRFVSQNKEPFNFSRNVNLLFRGALFFGLGCSGALLYSRLHAELTLREIENKLKNLDIIKALEGGSSNAMIEDAHGYVYQPTYTTSTKKRFSAEKSLTQSTYRSAHKIPIEPRVYYNDRLKRSIEVIYIGKQLSEGAGFIHEGVFTALLDESFARVAFQQFLSPIFFTANLQLDFKRQLEPDCFIKIVTSLVPSKEFKPYKATLKAEVFDLNDALIATASSVFIVPKESRATIGSLKKVSD